MGGGEIKEVYRDIVYDAKVMAERKTRETWFFRVCCFVVDPLCTPCDDRASTFLLLRRDTFAIPADYEPFLSFLFILYQCWIHHLPCTSNPGLETFSFETLSHGSLQRKKEKKKRKNSPLQWKSFSFVHDETLVVIESLLTDESYHSGISLSVTHTIRFYLKLSRNIFLRASSIQFEHECSRAEIVAMLFLARGETDRGGNVWIAINDAEQKRSIPSLVENVTERNGGVSPLEQMVKPSTKRFRFMAADKL